MKPTLTDDEIAASYRAAAQEVPGTELDARILAAARQHAASRAQEKKQTSGSWWRRWRIPVSVTAVAVLGVSLSFRVNEEASIREQQGLGGSATAQREAAPAGAAVNAPPPATATRPASPPADEPRSKPETKAVAAPQASHHHGPAPAHPRAMSPAVATLRPTAQPFPATPSAPAASAAPAPARAANTLADESRRRAERQQADSLGAEASRAEQEQAVTLSRQRRDTASHLDAAPEKKSALGAAGALSESAAPTAAKASAKKEADSAAHQATPERWLDHIRQLRRDGQTQTAKEELRRFQERHPDYALPADLR